MLAGSGGALAGAENEGFAEPLGLRQWHPVQRDGPAFHSGDINDEDPRVGRIDQTQSKPFILTHIDRKTVLSVRRNEISHAACVAAGMRRGEVGIDLCGFGIEKPIVQDQNLLGNVDYNPFLPCCRPFASSGPRAPGTPG